MTAAAHNLEAAAAGGAVVGDNLGAALDAARADAAYAQVLFVFLGLPGCGAGRPADRDRRRRRRRPPPQEQALLRARGASATQTGPAGRGRGRRHRASPAPSLGLVVAALVGQLAFGPASFGATTTAAVGWAAGSAAGRAGHRRGDHPAARPAGTCAGPPSTSGRAAVAALRLPGVGPLRPRRDPAASSPALVFTASSGNGYQLVLAPEGVPTISVSYWALRRPRAAVDRRRSADLAARRPAPRPRPAVLRRVLRPLTGGLAGPVAAGMSRQRRPLARAIVLLALALAFAASTATFNATYGQQAEADAQLTNGADVTVTEAPGAPVPAGQPRRSAPCPGCGGGAGAAPVRLHRRRPAGPLRGAARHHHHGHRAAGHLLPGRHRDRT